MKLLPLKFLTVFIIILFSLEFCQGQLCHRNKEPDEITFRQCSENESLEKNCPNSELYENKSQIQSHIDLIKQWS